MVGVSGKGFVWDMVWKLDLGCGICIGMEQVIPHVGNGRSKGLDSGEEATRRFQEWSQGYSVMRLTRMLHILSKGVRSPKT